jgi:hypothetical protein
MTPLTPEDEARAVKYVGECRQRYLEIREKKKLAGSWGERWVSYYGCAGQLSPIEEKMIRWPTQSFALPREEENSWDNIVKLYEEDRE